MKQFRLLFLSLFLAVGSSAFAQAIWYVNGATGANGNDGQSASTAFATIYYAVEQAADNDIIKVSAGTYTHPNININKDITIEGVETDASAVIIQAQATEPDYAGSGAELNKRIISLAGSANVSIKNLTLRYGNNTEAGGAIAVFAGQSISINNCNILNCYSGNNGGAIASWGSVTLTNSCIANNVSGGTRGGAIMGNSKQTTQLNDISVSNSVIYNNATTGSDNNGGGCAIFSDNTSADFGTVSVNSSTLAYNHILNPASGTKTVGIRFNKGKHLHITNSILFNSLNNLSSSGLEISATVGDVIDITINGVNHHNIIAFAWDKGIGTDCISKANATANHIKFDNLTLGSNGVYHLPVLAGSIAIDAADASTASSADMQGTSRGNAPDMGAFEYTTATNLVSKMMDVTIAPNPNNGAFNVTLTDAANGQLEVFGLSGQKLYSRHLVGGTNNITLPADIKGIVLLKLLTNGQTCTRKMLIK